MHSFNKASLLGLIAALGLAAASAAGAPAAALRAVSGFTLWSSTERPRSTSKSSLNDGFRGTWVSAAAIARCSSAEGVHTFSMWTFTSGFWEAGLLPWPRRTIGTKRKMPGENILLNTAAL